MKKWIVALLCIILACSMFTGCTPADQTDGGGNNNGDNTQQGGDNTDDDNTDDDNTDDDDDVEDTTGDTTFLMPVDEVNAVNSYGFYHNTTLDKYYLHTGIDFAGDVGDEVYAALDGTVESITSDPVLMGTTITLSHENGLKTTYTFIDAAEGLAVGDTVEKGDVIATVAEAMGQEYKDGAHLHFEVFLNDEAVDPETYLDIDSK